MAYLEAQHFAGSTLSLSPIFRLHAVDTVGRNAFELARCCRTATRLNRMRIVRRSCDDDGENGRRHRNHEASILTSLRHLKRICVNIEI